MASFASGYSVDTAMLTSNSKLGFKTGLESSLLNISNVQEGCFYLTSDTFRLYMGTSDGSLAPVNQGVITMETTSAITSQSGDKVVPGAFYYGKKENILCVFNGTEWVQINPDTNIKSITAAVQQDGAKAKVTQTLKTTRDETIAPSAFTVEGGENVTVTGSGTNVKIDVHDAEYTFETPTYNSNDKAATIGLAKDGTNVSNIQIAAGNNMELTVGTDGKITLGTNLDALTAAAIKSAAFSNQDTGFKLTLTKSDNTTIDTGATLDPAVAYGHNSKTTVKFVNGTLTMDVYTATEMDTIIKEKFNGLNALTYKGSRNDSQSRLPTSDVQIGDTYLQNFKGNAGGGTEEYYPGTLWIAQGDEDLDGYITADSLTWIPVQNFSADTTYSWSDNIAGNKWTQTITQTVDGVKTTAEQSTLSTDGAYITLTGSGSDATISHVTKTVTTDKGQAMPTPNGVADTSAYCYTGAAVTAITNDGAGHLTKVTESNILVPGTNVKASVNVTSASNVVTVEQVAQTQTTDTLWTGSSASTQTQYKSGTLTLTGSKSNTSAVVQIDLLWGSF